MILLWSVAATNNGDDDDRENIVAAVDDDSDDEGEDNTSAAAVDDDDDDVDDDGFQVFTTGLPGGSNPIVAMQSEGESVRLLQEAPWQRQLIGRY